MFYLSLDRMHQELFCSVLECVSVSMRFLIREQGNFIDFILFLILIIVFIVFKD